MSEETAILEKLYSIVPDALRPLALGMIAAYGAILIFKAGQPLIPQSRRTRRKKAVEEFLAVQVGTSSEPKKPTRGPDEKICRHFQLLREEEAFFDITGIRCKPEKRELLINLYEKCGDEWSWKKLASISHFLKTQEGELRYWIAVRSYLADVVFAVMTMMSGAGIIVVLYYFGRVAGFRNIAAVVNTVAVLSIVLTISISMLLPLARIKRLKKQYKIPMFDPRILKAKEVSIRTAPAPESVSV